MKGCTANAEVRHRFNQSGDADATCDLSSSIRTLNRICQMLDLGKESSQPAGQFSSFNCVV